jgi:diacylglycerol kinase family enzyme
MVAPEAVRAGLPVWHAPCGTENLFARAYGMTTDPHAVVAALVAGRTARVDLGRVNGEPFVLMASVGFDAEVVHELSRNRRGSISHLSYLRPILRLLGSWRASEVVWEIDGEAEALGPGLVVVGNHRDYGVRLNPACEAVPDDGLLDAIHIPVERAIGLLPWAALLRTGLHARHPRVRMRRGRQVRVWLDPAAGVQCDGDPVLGGRVRRLDLALEPGALEVLLPAGFAGR